MLWSAFKTFDIHDDGKISKEEDFFGVSFFPSYQSKFWDLDFHGIFHGIFYLMGTLQGTNISPKNGILKMIFLFPRWDMLIPWRVGFASAFHVITLFDLHCNLVNFWCWGIDSDQYLGKDKPQGQSVSFLCCFIASSSCIHSLSSHHQAYVLSWKSSTDSVWTFISHSYWERERPAICVYMYANVPIYRHMYVICMIFRYVFIDIDRFHFQLISTNLLMTVTPEADLHPS